MEIHGWESVQDGRRVLVDERAVRGLRKLAIDGFLALPKRGIEVGGILFGSARPGKVRVEGFEEGTCEHKYGPSYALSEADQQALAELLLNRRGGKVPVVGLFRSFASRDPVIEEADEALVREQFPRGDVVFLMLQPQSAERCLADARWFHDGALLPDSERPPILFESAAVEEASPEETPPVIELPPSYRARQEVVSLEPETRRVRWWIPVAICLASVPVGAGLYDLWTLAREPRWADLHLNARPVDGLVQLTWDGTAPRVAHATRGLLAVTDGDSRRDIALDRSQIQGGRYLYTPAHENVGVRLILYQNDLGVAGDAVQLEPVAGKQVARDTGPAASSASAGRAVDAADRDVPVQPVRMSAAAESNIKVPPLTVHEVQPLIPEGIRSRLSEEVVIPVEVEVSSKGRVVRATAVGEGGDSVRRYLTERAQKAAREWRFNPARSKSGARVAANKTIHFVFTP